MNDKLPRPAANRVRIGAAALLGAAVLAVSTSASAFGFGGHFGGGAIRHVPGGPAKLNLRTHAWPTRNAAAPREGWPRQRHWPPAPRTPRARVIQDGGPPPVPVRTICPANSHLTGSASTGLSCACNTGFAPNAGACVPVPNWSCPLHSHRDPHGFCSCDPGYVGVYGTAFRHDLLACVPPPPPPCGLPQCPSSDGGGPGSVGDVPQKPERAQ
jgi:hypothetical protein